MEGGREEGKDSEREREEGIRDREEEEKTSLSSLNNATIPRKRLREIHSLLCHAS